MPPCRRQVGASLRRPQRSERYIASYSESNFCAKSHTGGFWGAVHPLAPRSLSGGEIGSLSCVSLASAPWPRACNGRGACMPACLPACLPWASGPEVARLRTAPVPSSAVSRDGTA